MACFFGHIIIEEENGLGDYISILMLLFEMLLIPIWFRLDSKRALHEYRAMDIPYNKKIMKECGLSRIPSRRTFDRSFVTISKDIKNRITKIANFLYVIK